MRLFEDLMYKSCWNELACSNPTAASMGKSWRQWSIRDLQDICDLLYTWYHDEEKEKESRKKTDDDTY